MIDITILREVTNIITGIDTRKLFMLKKFVECKKTAVTERTKTP